MPVLFANVPVHFGRYGSLVSTTHASVSAPVFRTYFLSCLMLTGHFSVYLNAEAFAMLAFS